MTTQDTLGKAKAEKARQLLKSAAGAAQQLESDVRELVAMRAWEVLGYENFSEMWKQENGFEPPTYAQVLATAAMASEGRNTRHGSARQKYGTDGHTTADIARAVGLPVHQSGPVSESSKTVSGILKQLAHGVPAEHVTKTGPGRAGDATLDKYGTVPRKRAQPRRMGKAPDELVSESFMTTRREADEIAEIARGADTTKSHIYRQAVAEYLMHHRESRPGAAAS